MLKDQCRQIENHLRDAMLVLFASTSAAKSAWVYDKVIALAKMAQAIQKIERTAASVSAEDDIGHGI